MTTNLRACRTLAKRPATRTRTRHRKKTRRRWRRDGGAPAAPATPAALPALTSALDEFADKGTTFYETAKETAKETGDAVVSRAKDVIDTAGEAATGVVGKITTAHPDLIRAVTSAAGAVEGIAGSAKEKIGEKLTEAERAVKKAGREAYARVKGLEDADKVFDGDTDTDYPAVGEVFHKSVLAADSPALNRNMLEMKIQAFTTDRIQADKGAIAVLPTFPTVYGGDHYGGDDDVFLTDCLFPHNHKWHAKGTRWGSVLTKNGETDTTIVSPTASDTDTWIPFAKKSARFPQVDPTIYCYHHSVNRDRITFCASYELADLDTCYKPPAPFDTEPTYHIGFLLDRFVLDAKVVDFKPEWFFWRETLVEPPLGKNETRKSFLVEYRRKLDDDGDAAPPSLPSRAKGQVVSTIKFVVKFEADDADDATDATDVKMSGGGDIRIHVSLDATDPAQIRDVLETLKNAMTPPVRKYINLQIEFENETRELIEQFRTRILHLLQTDPDLQHMRGEGSVAMVLKKKEDVTHFKGLSRTSEPSAAASAAEAVDKNYLKPPVRVSMPLIQFYTMSDEWHADRIGPQFFNMGLKGMKLDASAGKENAKWNDRSENLSEANSLFVVDEEGESRLSYIYNIGRSDYAANVGGFFQRALAVLPAAVAAGATVAAVAGQVVRGGGGARSSQKRVRRRRHTVSRRNRSRNPTAASSHRTQRRRRRRGGGLLKSAKNMLTSFLYGKAKSLVVGKAMDAVGNSSLLSAVPKSLQGVVSAVGKAGKVAVMGSLGDGVPGCLKQVLDHARQAGAPHTQESLLDLGRHGFGGTLSSGIGLVAGIAAAWKLYQKTSIKPEEHRQVWGNQMQDYIYYKGVHVGEPLRFYYETLEFSEYSKKFLVYYLQCKLPYELHPNNAIPVVTKDGTTVLVATTDDFIPVMLQYRKFVQLDGALSAYAMESAKATLNNPAFLDQIQRAGQSVDSWLDAHLSTVIPPKNPPKTGEADRISVELRQRHAEKLAKLNRLTALSEVLLQETALHSLESLETRRIDMFYLGKDKVRSEWMDTLYKGVVALASSFAGKEVGGSLLLNMLTGGAAGGSSSSSSSAMAMGVGLAAGAAATSSSQAILGRLSQLLFRRFVPEVMYLFSKSDLDSCKHDRDPKLDGGVAAAAGGLAADPARETRHPYLFSQNLHSVSFDSTSQYVNDIFAATMNAPTLVCSHSPVTLAQIKTEQPTMHIFFDQFSHNWMPLEASTPCHFAYTKDLGVLGVRTQAGRAGVVVAYEMGSVYRDKTVGRILKEALDEEQAGDHTRAVPMKEQVRVMLFGDFHFASLEYEMQLADQLLAYWNSDPASDKPLFGSSIAPVERDDDDDDGGGETKELSGNFRHYIENTFAPATFKDVAVRKMNRSKSAGGAPPSPSLPKDERATDGGDDDFSEAYDEADEPTTAATRSHAADASSPVRDASSFGNRNRAYRSSGTLRMEVDVRTHTISLLLKSLRMKLQAAFVVGANPTIGEFLQRKYSDVALYTHVLSAVPFHTDDSGNKCKIMWKSVDSAKIGPFVISTKKSFAEFVGGNFHMFLQERFDDVVNAVDGLENTKGRLQALQATRVSCFPGYNTDPYNFSNGKAPESAEMKLRKSITAYSAIVKGNRDREQNEWKQMHRDMLSKRKTLLREQQKYALNHYYANALDSTKEIPYDLVVPKTLTPYESSWRPRQHHRMRYFERQREQRNNAVTDYRPRNNQNGRSTDGYAEYEDEDSREMYDHDRGSELSHSDRTVYSDGVNSSSSSSNSSSNSRRGSRNASVRNSRNSRNSRKSRKSRKPRRARNSRRPSNRAPKSRASNRDSRRSRLR